MRKNIDNVNVAASSWSLNSRYSIIKGFDVSASWSGDDQHVFNGDDRLFSGCKVSTSMRWNLSRSCSWSDDGAESSFSDWDGWLRRTSG